MIEKFRVVGFSHHSSDIDFRERLSFNESESRSFLVKMKEILGVEEGMVVSTCNRTEFYYSHASNKDSELLSLIKIEKEIADDIGDMSAHFKFRGGMDAVNHLFEVALGLDAKVLGDIQISNQMKRSYQASCDEQMAGPFLHRLMHSVFFSNKRVVQETAFRDGAASTSYASVSITQQFIKNFKNPQVLVVGLGEIGQDIAENLVGIKAEVTLVNRSPEKASSLAEELGFSYRPLVEALENITDYDVVISSAAVSSPIITKSLFTENLIVQKLFIDLSVPRSIDHELEGIPGIILYNIDQIEEKTDSIQQKRKDSIPAVRRIMDEAVAELGTWSQDMEVSPTIKKLKNALEDIRKDELKRYMNKVSEDEWKLLDKASKNIIQKVIKLPVLELKAACKRGEQDQLVEVLNELFNLEKSKSEVQ